jgi:hypothetical protein
MSYYTLPKINNSIDINPLKNNKVLKPYTCFSLYYFYHRFLQENALLLENKICEDVFIIINPYEFIHTIIPGLKYPISKISFVSSNFYDFLEVVYTLNVFEFVQHKNIFSIHISPNFTSSIDCMEILRENKIDKTIGITNLTNEKYNEKEFDFIFYELTPEIYENHNQYIISMLNILKFILKFQSNNGCCIIKISKIFYKSIIDIMFIFTSIYEKVHIIKPYTSNIFKYDKYLVCKGYIVNEKKDFVYKNYYDKISNFLSQYDENELPDGFIQQVIDNEIPYNFINKIDDVNIIIGQQLLESFNLIVNIIKNKNRDIKLDNIKKINIQKCIQWCEKYNIPCNKFIEKSNIFLKSLEQEEVI